MVPQNLFDNFFAEPATNCAQVPEQRFCCRVFLGSKRRTIMKKIALGLVAAATVFTAVPAMAQVGFYAGPGGFGVQVGPPARYYYDNGYPYGYYDYYGGPGVRVRVAPGWHGWHHDHHWHR
jgi:hypothetical protein